MSLTNIRRYSLQAPHQRTAKLIPLQLMHQLPISQHKLGQESPEDVVRLDVGVMMDRLDEILQLFVELRLDIINIVYLLHYLLDLDEVLLVCSRLGGQDGEVFVLVLASWSQVSEEGDLIVDSDDIAVDGLVIEDGVILYFLEEVAGLKGELSEKQRVTLLGVGDET